MLVGFANLESARLEDGSEPVGMTNEDHLVDVGDVRPADDLAVSMHARVVGPSRCQFWM